MTDINIVEELLALSVKVACGFDACAGSEVRDSHTTDLSTEADRAISAALITRIAMIAPGARILTEESGLSGASNADLTIAIDDLDGTDNFFRAPRILPWCTVVTVLRGVQPRFSDVSAAGIVEHRSGIAWLAEKGKGLRIVGSDGKAAIMPSLPIPLVDRRALVLFDHYAAAEKTVKFVGLHGRFWVKDFGSSALHLALVASGSAEGYVNPAHKAHELGAGYLLITEAGGSVIDYLGSDLGKKRFEFDSRYPIVAVHDQTFASTLLDILKTGEPA